MSEHEELDILEKHFARPEQFKPTMGPLKMESFEGTPPARVPDVSRIVEIDNERAELRNAMKALDDERAALEESILELFTDAGIQNMTVEGRTVYIYGQEWASVRDGNQGRAIAAANALGLGDAVTVSTARLSGMIRENQSLKDLPGFADAFSSEVRYSIRSRKAAKRKGRE